MIDKDGVEKVSKDFPRGKNETKRLFRHLRQLRKENPDITILLPSDKVFIYPEHDVRGVIEPRVMAIRHELDNGYGKWKGNSSDSHIKQVKKLLRTHFEFVGIPERKMNEIIDRILYV